MRLTSSGRMSPFWAATLLASYAAGTLFVGLHHEPWRDEADAWLVARDAPIASILSWTHNAGTPALWYVLLKTVVGLPYLAETILNLAIAWAAAAVLVIFAPLTRLTKLLLLASYFFFYEYAVIARSYSLTILLLFVVLAAMRKRPLLFAVAIALLFNTNVHGAVMAAVLWSIVLQRDVWRPDTRRSAVPHLVMLCGGLIAFLQLFPSTAVSTVWHLRLYAIPTAIADAFTPGAPLLAGIVAGAAVLATVAVATRSVFLVAVSAVLVALYTFVWFGGLRHSGLILVTTIAAIWLAADVPDTPVARAAAILLNVSLLASAVYAFNNARLDVRYAFSGSREMAEFIDHRFDDSAIAAHNMFAAEALLPYLPQHKFWYASLGRYGTFLQWDEAQAEGAQLSYESALRNAQQHFRGRKWLLLVNSPIPDPARYGFRLIHATGVPVFRHLDERYWLYAPR